MRVYVVFLAVLATKSSSYDFVPSGELKLESSYSARDRQISEVRPQIQAGASGESGRISGMIYARAWENLKNNQGEFTKSEAALTNLWIGYAGNSFITKVGIQNFSWGETFGFRYFDIVQTRNFRDYSALDARRNRLPVAAATGSYLSDSAQIDLIYAPAPPDTVLPKTIDGVPILSATSQARPEYGGKIRHLANQWNIDFIWYKHRNRFPSFTAEPTGLRPRYDGATSWGLSGSGTVSDTVIRSDFIQTHTSESDSIASLVSGADYIEGDITFGGQYHHDRFTSQGVLHGYSLLINYVFTIYSCEFNYYTTDGLKDYWASFNFAGELFHDFVWNMGYESINFRRGSALAFLQKTNRVLSSLSYRF